MLLKLPGLPQHRKSAPPHNTKVRSIPITKNARKETLMKYKSVIVPRLGSPKVLQVIENDLREPAAGEVRIKVITSSVCRPDITVRTGQALYAGTPLGKKAPFVPG